MHAQAHLARRLHAVQAGEIALGEQLAPAAVGENHELGHGLVERRAAPARLDRDAPALDAEAVLELRRAGARLAAARLQGLGEAPERAQLLFEGEPGLLPRLERGI